MVHFIFNIPRTYSVFYCKHHHAEVIFNMLGDLFGYRLRSLSKVGKKERGPMQGRLSQYSHAGLELPQNLRSSLVSKPT